MTRADPTDDDLLVHCVSLALEARDGGLEPNLAEICRDHPHLIGRVRQALDGASGLAAIDRSAQDFDGVVRRVLAGRYRLEARIGAGAMGVVYRGVDLELRRVVAVKVLQTDLFGNGAEAEARFAREAEVLAALQHKNVVTVFDRGTTEDGLMYLVMELLQGESLSQILTHFAPADDSAIADDTAWLGKRLGGQAQVEKSWLRQVVAWAADLAAGLHAAHAAGVLHRDVKPSNVFIDQRGCARLLDFGIATRLAHPTLADRRQGGLGTPAYMAPEQVDGGAPVAPTLDVYGLTATLYHLITLRPPYLGTPSQVIAGLQRRDPIPAYKLRRGLPRDLQAILDCGMARRPGARYATAADLEADLRRFLAYQPVVARARTPLGRAWSRARRSPAARLVAAALVVGGATLCATQWREHERVVRAQRWIDNWAPLPPNFALSPRLGNRVISDPVEFDAVRQLLDRAVADCVDPVPSFLLRAAFRLDHGDSQGAGIDFEVVAAYAASEYCTALARRYRDLPAGSQGARSVELADLPAVRTARDHYLAAFHVLRAWQTSDAPAQARQLVDHPELAQWAPAQELACLLLLLQASVEDRNDADQALKTYQDLYASTIKLEARLGRRTATTAQLLGSALVGQQRYVEGLPVLREGVGLSLWSYGLRVNLSLALRRVGELDEASAILDELIRRRPAMLVAYQTLIGVHLDRYEFDAARATVASAPFADDSAGRCERTYQAGLVEFGVALAQERAGEDCRAQARRADELLRESGRAGHEQRMAAALSEGDLDELLRLVLEILEQNPLAPDWLANLVVTLPPTLSADLTARVSKLFAAQARAVRRQRGATVERSKSPVPQPASVPQPSSVPQKEVVNR